MAIAVYLLGMIVTLLCAVLLLRHYAQVHKRLLLWSGLCFVGLTLSNTVLFVDAVMLPGNLLDLRLCISAGAMALLMYGLIWDSE